MYLDEHNRRSRRLHLNITVQVEPVHGELVDERGNARQFTGWLDLVELIEEYRSGSSDEGDGPPPA